MKKTVLSIILIFSVSGIVFGQNREKYAEHIKEAWRLYEGGDFLKSAEKYSEAFAAYGGKGLGNDRYNAACSWALANKPDSAFVQLFKMLDDEDYSDIHHITTDSDLKSLHDDGRWGIVIFMVASNRQAAEANLDETLVAMLDTIYQEDQQYRLQIQKIEEKYGWESDEMKAHWEIINEKDSVNLIKVKKILDERGWLGADVVGNRGNMTLFLVIQHADPETQQTYLPMMREAVAQGNASAGSLALLEDRVALRKGEKQLYGSQIGRDQETGEYYVLPLFDPDNVDARRAEMELGPLQEYIANWGMTWDVEAYKKKLPAYEAKLKK